jgi:hypothetical protein
MVTGPVAKRAKRGHEFRADHPEEPAKMAQKNMSETDQSYDKLKSGSQRGMHQSIDLTSDTPKHTFFSPSGRTIHRQRPATIPEDHHRNTDPFRKEQSSWQMFGQKLGGWSWNRLPQSTSNPERRSLELREEDEPRCDQRLSEFDMYKESQIDYNDELDLDSSRYHIKGMATSAPHLSRPTSNRQGHGNSRLGTGITKMQQVFTEKTFNNIPGSYPEPSVGESALVQTTNLKGYDRASLVEDLREKKRALEKYSKDYIKLKEDYEELQQNTQLKADREAKLERHIQHLIHKEEQKEREFKAEVRKLKANRDSVEDKYEDLIRKQQEESFKQMSTARWLPTEDSKVIAELDRIKRDMRSWARAIAARGAGSLEKLDRSKFLNLLESLSQVAVLDNNELPRGLSTAKSPALLLNALLAYHLHTTMFRSPFFFLDRIGGNELLRNIYEVAQNCRTNSP